MVCRCGMSHEIPSLRCDECRTWQHIYCYYRTENAARLPFWHICDQCRVDQDDATLDDVMRDLDMYNENMDKKASDEPRESSDNGQSTSLKPFGLSIEREVMWGLGDDEICDSLRMVMTRLLNVANSLISQLEISREAISKADNPDTFDLVHATLGTDDPEIWLQPMFTDPARHKSKRRRLLQAILAAAVTQWALTSKDEAMDNWGSALLQCYQEEVWSQRKYLYLCR